MTCRVLLLPLTEMNGVVSTQMLDFVSNFSFFSLPYTNRSLAKQLQETRDFHANYFTERMVAFFFAPVICWRCFGQHVDSWFCPLKMKKNRFHE